MGWVNAMLGAVDAISRLLGGWLAAPFGSIAH
jgi:hypothetical protein